MNSKKILLTGGSRGLGLQITQTLLEAGYAVTIWNRKPSPELERLLKTFSKTLEFLEVDLGNSDSLKKAWADWPLEEQPIHGLVNNAARAYDDLATNLDLDALEEQFRVNTYAPLWLTREVIRNMLFHRTAGSLVHLSSISVHTGYKGLSFYAASKGALEAFSKNVAREWGERGIRSNCVVCGFMDTAMTASLDAETREKIYRRTALRKATDPESVAATVEFLLSEKSRSITGQNLFVDSGNI